VALTGAEGHAGVPAHLGGCCAGLRGPEGDPGGQRSAAEDQRPSAGHAPPPGLRPPAAGLTNLLHFERESVCVCVYDSTFPGNDVVIN